MYTESAKRITEAAQEGVKYSNNAVLTDVRVALEEAINFLDGINTDLTSLLDGVRDAMDKSKDYTQLVYLISLCIGIGLFIISVAMLGIIYMQCKK